MSIYEIIGYLRAWEPLVIEAASKPARIAQAIERDGLRLFLLRQLWLHVRGWDAITRGGQENLHDAARELARIWGDCPKALPDLEVIASHSNRKDQVPANLREEYLRLLNQVEVAACDHVEELASQLIEEWLGPKLPFPIGTVMIYFLEDPKPQSDESE